jgi:hypothetical protein
LIWVGGKLPERPGGVHDAVPVSNTTPRTGRSTTLIPPSAT